MEDPPVLSATERSIVERERVVPGLATLLDPDAFLHALSAQLHGVELQSARRTYVRYKPGANCVVAHTLETELGPVEVYGKAYGRDAPIKFAKDRARKQVPSPLGPGRVVLEDQAIMVSIFPNDGKLSALADLRDPAARTLLLESVLPAEPRIAASDLRTIAYKPDRRYVAQLHARLRPWGVVKLYTGDGYLAARRRALAFRPGELLIVPTLLG